MNRPTPDQFRRAYMAFIVCHVNDHLLRTIYQIQEARKK